MATSTKSVSKSLRSAIYARDGFACVYCGDTLAQGARLSLDHVAAYALVGNRSTAANLVTACISCNSAKGKRSVGGWVVYLDSKGLDGAAIVARAVTATRPVDLETGKQRSGLLAA